VNALLRPGGLDAIDEFTAGLGRNQPGAVEVKAFEFLGSDGGPASARRCVIVSPGGESGAG
jgi:hypothetical protein